MTEPIDIIGRQIKIIGDHPYAGYLAKVIGLDRLGLRVSLMRSDAMNGHESYISRKDQFVAIPKNLESEQ